MEYVVGYVVYLVVAWAAIFRFYPHAASITGWRAFLLMPAVIPVGILGLLMGTHHGYRMKGKNTWGAGIEFNDKR